VDVLSFENFESFFPVMSKAEVISLAIRSVYSGVCTTKGLWVLLLLVQQEPKGVPLWIALFSSSNPSDDSWRRVCLLGCGLSTNNPILCLLGAR